MSTGKTKIRPKMLFDYESVTEDDGIYTFVNCLVLDATIGLPLGSEIFRLVYDSYDKTIQVGYDVINQKQLYNVELINMMEEGEKKLFLVSKFRTFMIEGAGDEKIFTLASLESMRTKIVVHELEQVEREGTYDLVSVLKGINLKKLRASGKAEIKALPDRKSVV